MVREAVRVAAQQWGVIGLRQLIACGVRASTVQRWVAEGRLHPIYPGAYALGHPSLPVEGRLVAALIHARKGAVLSHATAAWWWGLIPDVPGTIEVSASNRVRSAPGLIVHHPANVDSARHRRFPVTTVPQTLLDFAAGASRGQIRRAVAEADYLGRLYVPAVTLALGRGRRGSAALRDALEHFEPRFARSRSELEDVFLALCEAYAIPMPDVNVVLEGWLVDAVWRDRRVVVELDGYPGHRTPAQLERDHRRDLELRAVGFVVLRYTWNQVKYQPDLVARDLMRALGVSSPAQWAARGSR